MKIEAGKYYRTRDGRKVGPVELSRCGYFAGWAGSKMCVHAWNGLASRDGAKFPDDIMSEWAVDQTPKPGRGKTLRELDVKPGDVVNHMGLKYTRTVAVISKGRVYYDEGGWNRRDEAGFRIVSRAADTPKLWRDMTPEERAAIPQHYRDDPTNPLGLPFCEMSPIGKGALLLADHEGKVIERFWTDCGWRLLPKGRVGLVDAAAYRTKPKPKVETVTLHYASSSDDVLVCIGTINLIDGKPDCNSIKMEVIE